MWTCYHTPVYANQETFLSWYSKPSAHFLNYSIFSPQVFSIFKMKNHICTLFDNLSLIPSQSLMRQIVKVILILHCHSQNSKKSWGIPIILTFWFTHIFHTTSIFCKKNKTNRTPSPQPPWVNAPIQLGWRSLSWQRATNIAASITGQWFTKPILWWNRWAITFVFFLNCLCFPIWFRFSAFFMTC